MILTDTFEATSAVERALIDQAKKNKNPINGSLELLPLCNMSCDMCYVHMSADEMKQKGRLRTAEEWLEIARQMQKSGVLFLLLTGGEPLLYPEFKLLYLELKKLGFIITINTNGTLIDDDWADFFSKNKPRRINVTLYGANNSSYETLCHFTGGFTKAIHGIELLKLNKVDVRINASVTPQNAEDINNIIRIGHRLEMPVVIDSYMMPAERERDYAYPSDSRISPEEAAKYFIIATKDKLGAELFPQFLEQTKNKIAEFVPLEELSRMSCFAGNCSFTINWQGNMRPCVVMSEPSVSVFDVGFDEAWKQISSSCSKIRLCKECAQCNLRPVCRTCAASAKLETGSYDGVPDYMCRYAKEVFRLIELESERILNEKGL